MAARPRTLAVDIGGTGLKTIVLDAAGKPLTERLRVDTPRPATPRAVLAAIVGMAKQQGAFERVSVGFPGVVRRGVTETAWNLDPAWIGTDLRRRWRRPCASRPLGERRRRPGPRRHPRPRRRARDHARDGLRLRPLRRRAPRAQRPARPSRGLEGPDVRRGARREGPRQGRRQEVEPAARQGDRHPSRALQLRPALHRRRQREEGHGSTCRRTSGSCPTSPG